VARGGGTCRDMFASFSCFFVSRSSLHTLSAAASRSRAAATS
jgi:hypothetical protein